MQSIAVYLHVCNCLVIISEYRSALHAMTLMGGAAASETLIGGYIGTIGGAAPPQNCLESKHTYHSWPGLAGRNRRGVCGQGLRKVVLGHSCLHWQLHCMGPQREGRLVYSIQHTLDTIVALTLEL